jgi:hypothetical protein
MPHADDPILRPEARVVRAVWLWGAMMVAPIIKPGFAIILVVDIKYNLG